MSQYVMIVKNYVFNPTYLYTHSRAIRTVTNNYRTNFITQTIFL